MKHVKLFEQFINEAKKETLTAQGAADGMSSKDKKEAMADVASTGVSLKFSGADAIFSGTKEQIEAALQAYFPDGEEDLEWSFDYWNEGDVQY